MSTSEGTFKVKFGILRTNLTTFFSEHDSKQNHLFLLNLTIPMFADHNTVSVSAIAIVGPGSSIIWPHTL